MRTSVFLSYPKPFVQMQQDFIDAIKQDLQDRNLEPRTLGVTDYNMDAPLVGIRRLLLESYGLVTIAFRRCHIASGIKNPNSDMGCGAEKIKDKWTTSPYCHIEPAMAFQMGLPILVLRENGVLEDGILERGVTGLYLPEFNLQAQSALDYIHSCEWTQIVSQWQTQVHLFMKNKITPPKLF
nr:hypothetical protein [uncultured Agathobaculum sp.]